MDQSIDEDVVDVIKDQVSQLKSQFVPPSLSAIFLKPAIDV